MEFVEQRFHETARFWKGWIAKSKLQRPLAREMVNRSALMLKLLISREHGSLIAAPTFSLQEHIGGVPQLGLSFTWLLCVSFTLYALSDWVLWKKADAVIDWLKGRLGGRCGGGGPLQVMYGIDGRQMLR